MNHQFNSIKYIIFNILTALIGVKHITGSHTNALIYDKFVETVNEYNIEKKIFKIVSDGGSNMVKAFDSNHVDQYIEDFFNVLDEIGMKYERVEK